MRAAAPRWRKSRAKVGRVDDWLMTYADMITLLLCFFVVFVPAALAVKKDDRPLPTPVFADRVPVEYKPGKIELPFPPPVEDEGSFVPNVVEKPEVAAVKAVKPEEIQEKSEESVPLALTPVPEKAAEEVLGAARKEALVEETEAEENRVQKQTDASGERLLSVEIGSGAFFDSGSASLRERGKDILRGLAGDLKGEKYKDYRITVEGHTDDEPIHTPIFPSNWELSTARASAVVQFFLAEGIPAARLRAAGYADTFPKAPNRDGEGHALPKNQAENRRVVIKLEKIEPGV